MIVINGKQFIGNNVNVINGKVYVDGVEATPTDKVISIKVEGNIQDLKVDFCEKFEMTGNVEGDLSTMSGSPRINGDVKGKVKTMSGNVRANVIHGKVETMSGNIEHG